jgi:hypothetical protein
LGGGGGGDAIRKLVVDQMSGVHKPVPKPEVAEAPAAVAEPKGRRAAAAGKV